MKKPNQPPAATPVYLEVGKYCARMIMCEMSHRRGFIELFAQIEPQVMEKLEESFAKIIEWGVQEKMKNPPRLEPNS